MPTYADLYELGQLVDGEVSGSRKILNKKNKLLEFALSKLQKK